MIFDGREFARKRTEELVKKLEGRKVGLGIIYDPGNAGSAVYTKIKEKKAGELGVQFIKIPIPKSQVTMKSQVSNIKAQIEELNNDRKINGIVVQMPLGFGIWDLEIVKAIGPDKDVDGLREDSSYMPATVRAILEIVKTSPLAPLLSVGEGNGGGEVVVVGNKGIVGRGLMKYLPGAVGMDKEDFDPEKLKTAEVIISATGQEGLIKPEMVQDGVVCIDVGYPKGDFDPKVVEKASFFTPVPGGVGPATVVCLFENLIAQKTAN